MAMKFRNKALHEALMERKGGSHEAKAGKRCKRAKQVKADRRETRMEMNDVD